MRNYNIFINYSFKLFYISDTSNSSLNSTIQLPPLNPIPSLPYPNCGEVFKGTVSFNWVFDHNIDCQWILVVPSGMETSLTILVSLENSGGGLCTKDYVRIHSNGAWGSKYCSDFRVEEKFRDTVVMINYHTDHFNTYSYEVFTGISVTTIARGQSASVSLIPLIMFVCRYK